MSKTVKRVEEWFRGYDDTPVWLCFCRLVFAVSALWFVVWVFGPAVLGGDLLGFWIYQQWSLTHAGFLYVVVTVVTFVLAVISGIPTLLYERKKMKKWDESAGTRSRNR